MVVWLVGFLSTPQYCAAQLATVMNAAKPPNSGRTEIVHQQT